MLHLILLAGLSALLYLIFQRNELPKNIPPGPFRWPIVGNLIQIFMEDATHAFLALTKISKKYGEVVFFQTGLTYSVTINGYDAVKKALLIEDFHSRMDDKFLLDRTYGKPWGLINSNGDFWRHSRRFTVRHLRDFGFAKRPDLNRFIQRELRAMTELITSKISVDNTAYIKPKDLVMIPAVNIVWSSVSGQRFELTDPTAQSFAKYMYDFTRSMQFAGGIGNAFPFLLDWCPGLTGRTKINEYVKILQEHMKNLVKEFRQKGTYKDNPESFIEAYLQAIDSQKALGDTGDRNSIFSDEHLMAIVFDLFWAGIETTSTVLSFVFLYMIMYPEVQKKMRDEINSMIEPSTDIMIEDRGKLTYCRVVILETLRRASIVPFGPRKVFKDTNFNGYTIPANTSVMMNYYSINMDKGFWGDPENFRPERFIDATGAIKNADRVMAFSTGKRDCIGYSIAESSLFLAATHFVRNYEILPVPGHKYTLKLLPGLAVAPSPFPMLMKKIESG